MDQIVAAASDPAFRLRMPKPLLKQIDKAAAQAGRSRNSEIIYRLSESLRTQPEQSAAAAD